MSLEELQEAGILLHQSKWRKRPVRTKVPRVPVAITGALLPVAVSFMYFGDGRVLTWIGLGIFLVLLAGFTWASLRGIR